MLRAVASQILSGTWANKPASAAQGALYFASDVGESGTMFQYGGSRWRVFNGVASLKSLGAASSNIANSETIVLQALIPAGAWQTNDVIRVSLGQSKSGTTDSGRAFIRIGTAGSGADQVIAPFSPATTLAAANRYAGYLVDLKLASATSVQPVDNSGTVSSYVGGSANAVSSPVTITDASANALYVSLSISSSSTNDTVRLEQARIELLTP